MIAGNLLALALLLLLLTLLLKSHWRWWLLGVTIYLFAFAWETRLVAEPGAGGYGWMSGEALRPLSLHVNAAIAKAAPDFHSLYGSGGCMSAHDAVEYFMAGCSCVGVCSIGILRGIDSVERMCRDLSALLQKLGYPSVTDADEVARALGAPPLLPLTYLVGADGAVHRVQGVLVFHDVSQVQQVVSAAVPAGRPT